VQNAPACRAAHARSGAGISRIVAVDGGDNFSVALGADSRTGHVGDQPEPASVPLTTPRRGCSRNGPEMQESLPDRASWKFTMTSRWKSGQREVPRHLCSSPPAFGETWASKRGVKPSLGGCNSPVRSMKRSLPRRQTFPRKGPTGSRARGKRAKAMEGVKHLDQQPRGTLRRRGRGMVRQPSGEQERPVSAPAVRSLGCHPRMAWER